MDALIAERDKLLEELVDLLYKQGLVTDTARRQEILLSYKAGVQQIAKDFIQVVRAATVRLPDEVESALREAVYMVQAPGDAPRCSTPDPEDILERLELAEMRRDKEESP